MSDLLTLATDRDGIATITIDIPGRRMNVVDAALVADLSDAVETVLADDAVRGAILTSGKPAFIAGADLDWLLTLAEADMPEQARARAVYDAAMKMQTLIRRIETGGKPFVAAVNGLALGGGLEIALGCAHIVAADDPKIQLGLPEAKVGLMPGGGGTQRFTRIMGPLEALPYLTEGRAMTPAEALERGVIGAVAPAGDLIARARDYILSSSPEDWVKPWDMKGYGAPGTDPRSLQGSLAFSAANALQRKATWGTRPNLDAIQRVVYDGLNVPIDKAIRIETRAFARVMASDAARNMLRTSFINLQKAAKLPDRPSGVEERPITRLGVVGAGMMGAAIAHVAARASIDVTVIDVDDDTARRATDHIDRANARALASGRMSAADVEAIKARVTTGADPAALSDAELVIEAVTEDRDTKAEVLARVSAHLSSKAILATNTSTLPIGDLASDSSDATRFVGIHFFSPVEKMQLVEIIPGATTGDEALARALDFTRQISKTPVVVSDRHGFYTSRVLATYTREGAQMVMDGVAPALVENAARLAGMPVGPLALSDELGLDLMRRIAAGTAAHEGRDFPRDDPDALIDRLVAAGRLGRKSGGGFYDYREDGKSLWPNLSTTRAPGEDQPDVETLKQRFLAIQALEAVKCLDEGVVHRPEDADLAAFLGWGYAPWTGGPISYIDTMGPAAFTALCDSLAASAGTRFTAPDSLRERGAQERPFHARRPVEDVA